MPFKSLKKIWENWLLAIFIQKQFLGVLKLPIRKKTYLALRALSETLFNFLKVFFHQIDPQRWTSQQAIVKLLCVFSRRYSNEKSPAITVASFFRQTTDLIVYVPLFTEITITTQYKSGQCKLSAKSPPFIFYFFFTLTYKTGGSPTVDLFSSLCDFFENFLMSEKSPPSSFFYILQQIVS